MVDLLDSCGITKGELRPDWTARPLDPYEAILHGEVCPCALHQGLAVRVRIPGVRWRAPMHSLARFFGQPPQDGPLTDRPLTDGPLTNQPPMDLPPAEWESPGSDWAA